MLMMPSGRTSCINQLEDPEQRDRVAVVGTPGIGKSTTSVYLIKRLLALEKTVVYLRRSVEKNRHHMQLTPTVQVQVLPMVLHR
mmetsp:Transcript_8817/g.14646  ORF Transcript_8817/g.14646 Transcript_8817/m.14646 type:complete len:84 (-) Transcript_8817:347-598(-)